MFEQIAPPHRLAKKSPEGLSNKDVARRQGQYVQSRRPREHQDTDWIQMELIDGGEGGIRTLDTLPYTHFPGVRLRPLGHLSVGAEFSTASPHR